MSFYTNTVENENNLKQYNNLESDMIITKAKMLSVSNGIIIPNRIGQSREPYIYGVYL